MKPYWNEMTTPRPGLSIKEVELKYDNIYIEDAHGYVWQIYFRFDGQPVIQLLDRP